MKKVLNILYIICLIAFAGDVVISVIQHEYNQAIAWFIALIWCWSSYAANKRIDHLQKTNELLTYHKIVSDLLRNDVR